MRFKKNANHIAALLVLQAAGVGFASPAAMITPSIVEVVRDSPGRLPGSPFELSTQSTMGLAAVITRSIIDWLPKDNQTTYVLKQGEIRRLELNSSELDQAPLVITVSPCTRNLVWSVYHGHRNRTKEGWTLMRQHRGGETDTFAVTVSSNDRYIVELSGSGGGEAAGAVSARGERGAGVRLRLRLRSKKRLSASWDHSPIDPQATSYCVVASSVRSYSSLCAARLDCKAASCKETAADCLQASQASGDCQQASQDKRAFNMAGEMFDGQNFKNYVRRKKYSRSTKLTDSEPVVVCVGGRTHHIIENVDFSKIYHVSVFGVGRDRAAGVLLGAGSARPRLRAPAPAARALREGGRARAELKGGRTAFYYKTKGFSDGVWLGAVTCGGAVDIEVSVKGRRLHLARNVGPSVKFFVPAPRLISSAQESEETSSIMESSSEEARLRYVVRVTPGRRESRTGSIFVEVSASSRRRDVRIPQLQQHGGDVVRELRPMRSCRSLHVAFLPAQQPLDVVRYCVTARELDGHQQHVAGGADACGALDVEAHARMHCADHSASAQNVITQGISGLRPGRKYTVLVTATSEDGLPVSYSSLYAETSPYCKED